jgi:hypothetical protein
MPMRICKHGCRGERGGMADCDRPQVKGEGGLHVAVLQACCALHMQVGALQTRAWLGLVTHMVVLHTARN